MLSDELRDILRDYAVSTGARSVAIVAGGPAIRGDEELQVLSMAVGNGSVVRAEFPAGADDRDRADDRAASLERTARALRACARRHDAGELPHLSYPGNGATNGPRVLERIVTFLRALESCQGLVNAVIYRRGRPIASAEPLDPEHADRLPFTVRRVDAEVSRHDGSSHAEVAELDSYALSFYYDAYLVAFFDGPYALDFVRYRVRLVTRELSELLALLDDSPDDPADAAPIPT